MVKRCLFIVLVLLGSGVYASSVIAEDASQEARVKAIMQQSKAIQSSAKASQSSAVKSPIMQAIIQNSQSHAKQALVGAGDAAPKFDSTSSPSRSAPVSAAQRASVQAQHQTDQKIAALTQRDAIFEAKLKQLDQVLSMLNQEVTQLGQQIQSAQQHLQSHAVTESTVTTPVQLDFLPVSARTIQYSLYIIGILLLLVLLMLVFRRSGSVSASRRVVATSTDADQDDDLKDEYDFMGTEEANPAKLDLARAYIAMEDYKAAKKVLAEVIKTGSPSHQAEANSMLTKIPSSES